MLHVLYLIFNEGYTASSGDEPAPARARRGGDPAGPRLHRLLPDDSEVAGLLALMLLTDARRAARTDGNGDLIPLADQDRSLGRAVIDEGAALITRSAASRPVGPYQLQAAIAAVHDEAVRAEDTDWREIVALYRLLERVAPNPVVTLNHAVAVAMVDGPEPGLAMLDELERRADGEAPST